MALIGEKSLWRRIKRSAGLLVMLAVLLVACPLAVMAADTAVSIPDASAAQGEEATVPITITDVSDFGAVDIWLHYDNSVVEVSDVAEGELGVVTYGIDNPSGVTKMNWFSATGETGDFVFAYVTLRAVGGGGSSSLELEVRTLVNIDGDPVSHSVDGGTFTAGLVGGQYTLTISSVEGGSVTTPGEGTFAYDAGEVDLAAEADVGYQFDGWTGDVGTVADADNPRTTITMDADKAIAAAFTVVAPAGAGGLSTTWIIVIIAVVVVAIVAVFVVRRRRRYD